MKDEKSVQKIESKLSIVEQELIDLKNKGKNSKSGFINGPGGIGGIGMSQAGFAEKFDVLLEEVNSLWSFTQRFIDEQVMDGIMIIRSSECSIREKMNQMDWLARNSEFFSPDAINKLLLSFKELYLTDHLNSKNAFITAKHTSAAVITVLNLIDLTRQIRPRDDETVSRLNILTSVLEPLLVNDMNNEKAIEARIMELLVSLLYVPEEIRELTKAGVDDPEDVKKRLPGYIKYTLRCITSSSRSPLGVVDFLRVGTSVAQVLDLIQSVPDEEILANSAKVLRLILRDDKHYDVVTNKHVDMANNLLEAIQKYSFSEVVINELLGALRNFTRSPAKV